MHKLAWGSEVDEAGFAHLAFLFVLRSIPALELEHAAAVSPPPVLNAASSTYLTIGFIIQTLFL